MGGWEFDYEGRTYYVPTEGGVPIFLDDEVEEAFEKWRESPEGIEVFGPVPTDWSKEHYLDDRYPWDRERECRIDPEEDDYGGSGGYTESDDEDCCGGGEADIDWSSYEKCRYGCYRQFYITSEAHICSNCGVYSCKSCAASFKKCAGSCCEEKVCGQHKYCSYCQGNVGSDQNEESASANQE